MLKIPYETSQTYNFTLLKYTRNLRFEESRVLKSSKKNESAIQNC
jgi:hypothetical protein